MPFLTDIPPLLTPLPPLPQASSSSRPEVLLRIKTPYNADAFEKFFTSFPHLKEQYPLLTRKLRHGFPMGDFPPKPPTSVTWPNGRSVLKHTEFVDEYFADEVAEGRLSGPYTRSEVEAILGGPFQCSPITIDVQPQGPGEDPKLRLCSDFSRRTNSNPATNDYSDIRDFPTRFDGAREVAQVVAESPQGTEAMTLDISKFHRRTPIAPAHKRWFVMQGKPGQFYIQHCAPFGARTSEGNSGEIANAALDIWRELGVGPICKWADDIVVFRNPIPGHPNTFEYDRAEALRRIESLGIPWHPEKGQDFSPRFTYVGFDWDIPHKSVALPSTKREEFLRRLDSFLQHSEHSAVSKEDAMVIQGTLAHVLYVYPEGRTRLLSLSRFIASFESLKVKAQLPPSGLRDDMKWWATILQKPGIARSVVPRGQPQNLGISVDASGDWGIGIVWKESWDAWKSHPGWKTPGRDIGWLEGVAVELVVYVLKARGIKNMHVLIRSDNQGIIGAFNKGASRNVEVNLSIQRAITCLSVSGNSLHLEYVRSENNPADPVSRGKLMSPSARLKRISLPPELQPYLSRA